MAGEFTSSTHPPLPPTTEDDRIDRLRLLRSRRVGISTYNRLMAEYGSAAEALRALPEVAAAAGVADYRATPEGVIAAELKAGARAGARLICHGDPDYPEAFGDVPDAPPLFWALGDAGLLHRPSVALVGARNASSLGIRMARALAEGLGGAGVVVVSGLARGVDTAAHAAALDTGTVAVQAGGIDVVYPAENADLAARIARTGLRLAEQPPGVQPQARHFPARNRIISALSQAVVVVEAAARSGSLITARTALDQGREVFAVPGSPLDGRAAGCNMLIRDGATLVRNAEDVLEALGPLPKAAQVNAAPPAPRPRSLAGRLADTIAALPRPAQRPKREIAALHRQILDRLGPAPVAEDQLLRDLDAAVSEAAPALLDLELDGAIRREPGGLVVRIN